MLKVVLTFETMFLTYLPLLKAHIVSLQASGRLENASVEHMGSVCLSFYSALLSAHTAGMMMRVSPGPGEA